MHPSAYYGTFHFFDKDYRIIVKKIKKKQQEAMWLSSQNDNDNDNSIRHHATRSCIEHKNGGDLPSLPYDHNDIYEHRNKI